MDFRNQQQSCLFIVLIIAICVQCICRVVANVNDNNNNNKNNNENWAIANSLNPSPASSSSYFKYETCTWFYRGNPTDCGTYYQCDFGKSLLRDCPPGLFWNKHVNTCDWPHNVRGVGSDCIDTRFVGVVDSDKESDTVHILGEDEEGFDNVRDEPCNEGEFYPNSKTCNSFFVCNHGTLLSQSCPNGLNWNADLKICDWPNNVKCQTTGSPTEGTIIAPSTIATTSSPAIAIPTPSPSPIPIPSSTGSNLIPRPESSEYKVICYFTDWAWYRPGLGKYSPPNINPSLCTHIIYSFALLNKYEFIIKTADSWADLDNKFYEQVTNLKTKHNVKVSIALGGWNDSEGDGYSRLVNSPANRAKFIASVVEFIKKYNFDGIDLDWEYPKCWQGDCNRGPSTDKAAFASFVQELRSALPSNALLSSAVSASKVIIDSGYDVPTMANNLDWIGVMDYDFHGSWDKKTGHIAPLYYSPGDDFEYFNVNSSITHWKAAGAPAKKLIVGIPLYGQSFTLADSKQKGLNAPTSGPGSAGQFTRQAGVLSYYEICGQNWDQIVQNPSGAMGPYAIKGNQWISYDDIDFVKVKADYIKKNKLGGAMIWALDFDDFSNSCGQGEYPLLTAINNKLNS